MKYLYLQDTLVSVATKLNRIVIKPIRAMIDFELAA